MISVPYPPAFIASASDTSDATPVDQNEFSHLVSRLDAIVMPALWQAMLKLQPTEFRPVQVARHAGLASLVLQREHPETDAWLYFQIHRSFGASPAGESIFWMYAIHHPAGTTAGRPGCLPHLDDSEPVDEIISEFILACTNAPHLRHSAESLRNPPDCEENVIAASSRVRPTPAVSEEREAFALKSVRAQKDHRAF
jgi:hypothetical protein